MPFLGRPSSTVGAGDSLPRGPGSKGAADSTRFGNSSSSGETWHERRSLFAAVSAINELVKEEQQLKEQPSD